MGWMMPVNVAENVWSSWGVTRAGKVRSQTRDASEPLCPSVSALGVPDPAGKGPFGFWRICDEQSF